MNKKPIRQWISLSLIIFCGSLHAVTQEELLQIIERQSEQIENLQQRVTTLESNRNSGQPPPAETLQETRVTWPGAPELSGAGFSFSSKGRLQMDAWAIRNDAADYPTGTEMRRVRFGLQGRLVGDYRYKAELEFSGQKVGFEDLYVSYEGFDRFSLLLGHHEAPVSLEDETSDTATPFLERSPYNAFTLDRSVGIAALAGGKNWSLKAGIFGDPAESGAGSWGDEGWRSSVRFSFSPRFDGGHLMHLGVSSYFWSPAGDPGNFSVRARPDSHFLPGLVDTGNQRADRVTFFGTEFAGVIGPLTLQSEWGVQQVDYLDVPDTDFMGGYGQVSWLATGESRPYRTGSGKFDRIQPLDPVGEGGPGALELALRYSYIDLADGVIEGGTLNDWTLAISWYLNANARLVANWVHFEVEDSSQVAPLGFADHSSDALGLRAELLW